MEEVPPPTATTNAKLLNMQADVAMPPDGPTVVCRESSDRSDSESEFFCNQVQGTWFRDPAHRGQVETVMIHGNGHETMSRDGSVVAA